MSHPFSFSPFEAKRLAPSDAPRLQDFFAACEDYFRMVEGEPAGPEDAERERTSLPPGKSLEDKFFLGLLQPDGTLAGVIDVVRDYPEPGIWYLGLLLLHPALRGKGLGEALHAQLRDGVRNEGGHALRLGVLEVNEKAHRFWARLGYRELSRKPFEAGKLTHTVRVMQLPL